VSMTWQATSTSPASTFKPQEYAAKTAAVIFTASATYVIALARADSAYGKKQLCLRMRYPVRK